MIPFLFLLSRTTTLVLFGLTLLLSLAGGAVAIAYGVLIRNELAVLVFSEFLTKSVADLTMQVGVTVGTLCIALSLLGIILLTPVYCHFLPYLHSPLCLLCSCCLLSLGFYLHYCGDFGALLLRDYCSDNYERWTRLHYGLFPVALDNTYAEMEGIMLCNAKCPCQRVNYTKSWP